MLNAVKAFLWHWAIVGEKLTQKCHHQHDNNTNNRGGIRETIKCHLKFNLFIIHWQVFAILRRRQNLWLNFLNVLLLSSPLWLRVKSWLFHKKKSFFSHTTSNRNLILKYCDYIFSIIYWGLILIFCNFWWFILASSLTYFLYFPIFSLHLISIEL